MPFQSQPTIWKFSRDKEREQEAASDPVNPSHYEFPNGARVIDITQWLNFNRGNVVKYVSRAGRKSASEIEDLRKAMWYLQMELRRLECVGMRGAGD